MTGKSSRLLAIDIGNTSAQFAQFSGEKLRTVFRIPTAEFKQKAVKVLRRKLRKNALDAAVIASVVPSAGRFLRKILSDKFRIKTFLIGKDLQPPVVNRYRNPKQVGTDRLMNALAVFHKYKRSAIIVDFGTAITFDVVSGKGEYLGGVIAPGIEISLEALFQRTALLPRIRLAHPHRLVGRDTVESIRVGCSVGIGGLCDRVIDEIKRVHRWRPMVIATGGYASFMSRYCKRIEQIESSLTLEGILITYRHFIKNSR